MRTARQIPIDRTDTRNLRGESMQQQGGIMTAKDENPPIHRASEPSARGTTETPSGKGSSNTGVSPDLSPEVHRFGPLSLTTSALPLVLVHSQRANQLPSSRFTSSATTPFTTCIDTERQPPVISSSPLPRSAHHPLFHRGQNHLLPQYRHQNDIIATHSPCPMSAPSSATERTHHRESRRF